MVCPSTNDSATTRRWCTGPIEPVLRARERVRELGHDLDARRTWRPFPLAGGPQDQQPVGQVVLNAGVPVVSRAVDAVGMCC